MTITDFLKAHGLKCRADKEEEVMYKALEKIYLEMSPESAVRMILDYFDQADDIYNAMEALQKVVADGEEN